MHPTPHLPKKCDMNYDMFKFSGRGEQIAGHQAMKFLLEWR